MNKSKVVGLGLIVSGSIFALLSLVQLTKYTHLHAPSSYFVNTPILEELIAGNQQLEVKFKKESDNAMYKIKTILATHREASFLLAIAGCTQIVFGYICLGFGPRTSMGSDLSD